MKQNNIVAQKNGYKVTKNQNFLQKRAIYQLRHQVFSNELQWVDNNEEQLEIDEYDNHSKHLTLLDQNEELIGTIRVTDSSDRWMIEDYFSHLIADDQTLEKNEKTVEISRLTLDKVARNLEVDENEMAIDLLLRGLFTYAAQQQIEKFYLVVSNVVHRLLKKRGVFCQPIGKAVKMPDGVVAIAAELNVRELVLSQPSYYNQWGYYSPLYKEEGEASDNFSWKDIA